MMFATFFQPISSIKAYYVAEKDSNVATFQLAILSGLHLLIRDFGQ